MLKSILIAAGIGGVIAYILFPKDDTSAFFKGALIGAGVQFGLRMSGVS